MFRVLLHLKYGWIAGESGSLSHCEEIGDQSGLPYKVVPNQGFEQYIPW